MLLDSGVYVCARPYKQYDQWFICEDQWCISFSTTQSSMLYRQSAFGSYLRPNTHFVYVKNGRENLMKRCFKFLRKIEAKKLNKGANIQEQHEFNVSLQNKAYFHHMIVERKRRVKLKHHFSLLHSLLPYNSRVL
jgi:hypothetical protein